MAPKVAILKSFKPHLLLNGKSDLAKTWWEALGWHGNSELLKWYPQWLTQQPSWRSIVSLPGALLKVSLCCGLLTIVHSSPICPSETFQIFDISIKILSMRTNRAAIFSHQLLSSPEPYVGWSGNLVEGIGAAWRFRIAKMVPFWYPRWPSWQPS